MKILKSIALAIIAICIVSCGNDSDSVTLKVESELGEFAKFASSTDEEVVVKLLDDKDGNKDVKSMVASIAFQVNRSVASDYSFCIEVTVLDENHVEIGELPYIEIESNTIDSDSDIDYALSTGTIRAQMSESINVEKWQKEEQEKWDKIRTQGKYIMLKLMYSDAKFVEYNGDSSSIESNIDDGDEDDNSLSSVDDDDFSSTSDSQDWDALLDSYEQYVDKYISYVKKAAKGDTDALAEYPSLMEKAKDFSEKMENAQGEMSASQWARYMKITSKMTTTAAEI